VNRLDVIYVGTVKRFQGEEAYFQSHREGKALASAYLHHIQNHTYLSSHKNKEGLSYCSQDLPGK